MPTTVTSLIGATGDYTSLAAWEAACPMMLVMEDKIWRGEMMNEEFVVAGNILTIAGQVTNATCYVELTTASGASFADNASKLTNALRYNASNGAAMRSAGAGYTTALSVSAAYTRLSKFQFKDEASPPVGSIVISGENCQISQVLAYSGISVAGSGVFENTAPGSVYTNCLAILAGTGAFAAGFSGKSGTTTYYNCFAIKPSNVTASGRAFQSGYSSLVIKNCAGFGFADFYGTYGGVSGASGNNNASDVTISFGTSNQSSLTYANQIVQSNSTTGLDCRTLAGANIIATGENLSGSGVTTDIVGTSRVVPYDIGVWQYASAAAPSWTPVAVWL